MAKARFEMHITFTWWFRWIYHPGLRLSLFVAQLIDLEYQIDESKLEYWIKKGIRINGRKPK